MSEHAPASRLLRERRYWPLFWTQFSGAFNDNFFKNALGMLITFRAVNVGGLAPAQMVALSGAIFILPYFLFSATAGQITEKVDKAALMRWVKVAEIAIMAVGAVGFITGHVPLLLFVLFGMGVHSTVFGPSKYSILPQLLTESELVAGNALVETGTYIAILLGTIAGGVLVNQPHGEVIVAVGCLLVAVVGTGLSTFIPSVAASDPELRVQLNPVTPTWQILRIIYGNRTVWLSILAISWFWAYGVVLLSMFGPWTKDVLHGDEALATLFLALFSVGIGVGSMVCERLSRHRLELGLVPLGSIGMSIFTLDLWLVGEPWPAGAAPMTLLEFLTHRQAWRIIVDLAAIAGFGGLFIVPLYTLIQLRSDPRERSRVIAGNNIVNAVLMVLATVALAALEAKLTLPQIFAVTALANGLVALYVYSVLPEFLLRFATWVLSNLMYRVTVEGLDHIPQDGPVVLVSNHVTFVDWLFIAGACKRPARFVMDKAYFDMPLVKTLFRHAKVIPIASAKEDPDALAKAFDKIAEELVAGEVVCIFPEGRLTLDGTMHPFRPGVEKIVQRTPAPVVPMALNGLWGSFFSRKDGQALKKPFRRVWSKVSLQVGPPIPPEDVRADHLQTVVTGMWERYPEA